MILVGATINIAEFFLISRQGDKKLGEIDRGDQKYWKKLIRATNNVSLIKL